MFSRYAVYRDVNGSINSLNTAILLNRQQDSYVLSVCLVYIIYTHKNIIMMFSQANSIELAAFLIDQILVSERKSHYAILIAINTNGLLHKTLVLLVVVKEIQILSEREEHIAINNIYYIIVCNMHSSIKKTCNKTIYYCAVHPYRLHATLYSVVEYLMQYFVECVCH